MNKKNVPILPFMKEVMVKNLLGDLILPYMQPYFMYKFVK